MADLAPNLVAEQATLPVQEMEMPRAPTLMPDAAMLRRVVLIALFALALGLRVHQVTRPPIEFVPMRQYRSALIARSLYVMRSADMPEWQREVAAANLVGQDQLEPQIMENLLATTYLLLGQEILWLSRVYSITFWLIGGIFLYQLAMRMFDNYDAALFATGFYLLMPFAVVASRSFQPDPLSIMLTIISLYLVWEYHASPSIPRVVLAAAFSAAAAFTKPIVGPAIFLSFAALFYEKRRTWRFLYSVDFCLYAAITVTPMLLYYIGGALAGTYLESEMDVQLDPRLLTTRRFWVGWLQQVNRVIGHIPFIGALFGVLLVTRPNARAMLFGMWLGYLIFMLTFTYTVMGHDYYQLQLLVIAGLSLTPVMTGVMAQIRQLYARDLMRAALLIVVITFAAGSSYIVNWYRHYYDFYFAEDPTIVAMSERVGELTNHSTRNLMLTVSYGIPVMYHGELSGTELTYMKDLDAIVNIARQPAIYGVEALEQYLKNDPEYFIVFITEEYYWQPELIETLYDRYPVIEETDEYVVFDLQP